MIAKLRARSFYTGMYFGLGIGNVAATFLRREAFIVGIIFLVVGAIASFAWRDTLKPSPARP